MCVLWLPNFTVQHNHKGTFYKSQSLPPGRTRTLQDGPTDIAMERHSSFEALNGALSLHSWSWSTERLCRLSGTFESAQSLDRTEGANSSGISPFM